MLTLLSLSTNAENSFSKLNKLSDDFITCFLLLHLFLRLFMSGFEISNVSRSSFDAKPLFETDFL